jgi:excisionase family DNA binding protein
VPQPPAPKEAILALSDSFLSKEQVAEMLGVSTATLLRWHNMRIGPPRVKIGRTIRYPRQQAEEYLNAHAT